MKKFINYIAPCIEVVGYRQKKKGIKSFGDLCSDFGANIKFIIGPRKKFRNKAETNIYFLSKRKFQSEKKQSFLRNIKFISGIIILVVGGYILSN